MSTTLYRGLADLLRADIARGRYPPGAHLPTELELCAQHGVSRHTAREALRLLQDDGLIARRRGAGTTVAAAPTAPRFAQSLDGLEDLLQYAREARLEVSRVQALRASDRRMGDLELDRDVRWTLIEGLRREASGARRPIAATSIVIRSDLAPTAADLTDWPRALNEWVAERHGVRTGAISQEIAAVALSPDEAASLETEPGAPALRTVRRYADAGGAPFQASVSLHPGDRFVYAMRLDRTD